MMRRSVRMYQRARHRSHAATETTVSATAMSTSAENAPVVPDDQKESTAIHSASSTIVTGNHSASGFVARMTRSAGSRTTSFGMPSEPTLSVSAVTASMLAERFRSDVAVIEEDNRNARAHLQSRPHANTAHVPR